ncbi:MAG: AMP-binding protein, partial [Bradyrhizobium guangdongense]
MNIIDAILYQCRINPAVPAICAPGTALNVVSYGRLERFIMSVAGRAAKLGLTSGTTTAILCDDPVLHSALLLGLTHAGIATVSLRCAQLPAGVVIQAVISDRDAVFPMGPTVLRADQAWLTDTAPAQRTARLHPDALCRLILTSGTTGNAKCVALTHDRIWQRLALHNFALG